MGGLASDIMNARCNVVVAPASKVTTGCDMEIVLL